MKPAQTHTLPQHISRAVELAEATTSLDLLRRVDRTVDALAEDARHGKDVIRILRKVAASIKKEPVVTGVMLDPDDIAIDACARAEAKVKTNIQQMLLRRNTIDAQTNLDASHKESLRDSYEEWLITASGVVEAFKAVRHNLIGHDLDAEDLSACPRFDNAEDLIADLRK
ncbi:MAG: hypothetical protein LBI31_04045 [Zoogloeaceae bacterium]|nr:hypothetical protein [Zoogloeaceae bacterium]